VNIEDFVFDGLAVYPEYLTDPNILICPSDADGLATAKDNWYNAADNNRFDPCALSAVSYYYLGWAFAPQHYLIVNGGGDNATNPQIGQDWSQQLITTLFNIFLQIQLRQSQGVEAAVALAANLYDGDLTYRKEGDSEDTTIHRLREGIERFFITDINNPGASAKAQSEIAVMYDMVQRPHSLTGRFTRFNHVPGGGNVLYMDGHVEFLRYPDKYPVSRTWAALLDYVCDMADSLSGS
jgi:prepilin-type processing-associated H-X9-DG protein